MFADGDRIPGDDRRLGRLQRHRRRKGRPGRPCGRAVPLGDSSRVVVGEPVAAIGSPFGKENSLAVGVVSAISARSSRLTSRYDVSGRSRSTRRSTTATRAGRCSTPRPCDRDQRPDPLRLRQRRRRRLRDPINAARRSMEQLIRPARSRTPTSASRPRTSRRVRAPLRAGRAARRADPAVASDAPAEPAGLRGRERPRGLQRIRSRSAAT